MANVFLEIANNAGIVFSAIDDFDVQFPLAGGAVPAANEVVVVRSHDNDTENNVDILACMIKMRELYVAQHLENL